MMRTGQMILAQALIAALAAADSDCTETAMDLEARLSLDEAGGCDPSSTSAEVEAGSSRSCQRLMALHEASILRWFADSMDAPFSIHRITLEGAAQGTPVGRWLGPASIAQVLSQLVARALLSQQQKRPAASLPMGAGLACEHNGGDDVADGACRGATLQQPGATEETETAEVHRGDALYVSSLELSPEIAPSPSAPPPPTTTTTPLPLPAMSVHVSMDHIIFRSEVIRSATGDGSGAWQPLLLLVPLRLGLDAIDTAYVPFLQGLLKLPQSLGIIGGRPRKSFYFVGYQQDKLLYLDPHEVQPALGGGNIRGHVPGHVPGDMQGDVTIDVASCHFTGGVRSVPFNEIDPTLAAGFFCKDARSFDALCCSCTSLGASCLAAFSVSESPPDYEARLSDGDDDDDPDLVVVGPNV